MAVIEEKLKLRRNVHEALRSLGYGAYPGWGTTVPNEAVNYLLGDGYSREHIDFDDASESLDVHAQDQLVVVCVVVENWFKDQPIDGLSHRLAQIRSHIEPKRLAKFPNLQL